MHHTDLTHKEKNLLFWASFLALMAAGIGFGIRVLSIGTWIDEFKISGEQAGAIFGASLWPIAVAMIGFSLVVDKIGYKVAMAIACALQVASTIWTFYAADVQTLTLAFILAGFAHGIIETCINPLCATTYKKDKSKMLNILHASWPAGIAIGAILALALGTGDNAWPWRHLFGFLIIPALIYGVIFLTSHKYPEDERVEADVSYTDMLREFGGLGIFVASTFVFYELASQLKLFAEGGLFFGKDQLIVSLIVGALVGILCGFILKAKGRPLFFILCLIMIPLATAEIATDGWIAKLMQPVLSQDYNINAGWAIVLSSLIMMVLRFFAGVPLRFMSPPALLLLSSIFSVIGLFMLSGASGILIFLAFVIYAIGQTFYWPTMLGFVSEQFPKGGAMTLNTVSAMGLLTVGIFGIPFLGAVGDKYDADIVQQEKPALFETHKKEATFFSWKFDKVNLADVKSDLEIPEKSEDYTPEQKEFSNKISQNGRKVLKTAAILPFIMGIAFFLILLYYKSKGGYKPVHLDESSYTNK